MRKQVALWATGILALLGVAIFAFARSTNKGEVSIVNEATESIRAGKIVICGHQFEFGELKPREKKQIPYKVRSDSHYDMTVQFAPGKTLTRQVGYVTSGTDFHDTLTVKDDEVSLTSRD
jgi:hypothetical protein